MRSRAELRTTVSSAPSDRTATGRQQALFFSVRTTQISTTGAGVRVGIIDSGWDQSLHDERISAGVGLVDDTNDSRAVESKDCHDRLGHGTACANLVLDVAPESTIVPIRVFGRRLETSPDIIGAAIDWALHAGIRVINLSLGTAREDAVAFLYSMCEQARRDGVVIVAAAHLLNNGWIYPAVFKPVIGVGSRDLDDPFLVEYRAGAAVECRARTKGRRVKALRNRELLTDATSFAAPLVTGLVARLLEASPALDVDGMRQQFLTLGQAS